MAVRPIDANAMLNELRPVSFEAEHSAVLLSDVSKMMREWVERQPTLTPPNEWVSVEERLPEEKQRVIVRCERVGTSVGWILWGNWMADIGPDAGKVTHWMLLPAPPDSRPPEGEA